MNQKLFRKYVDEYLKRAIKHAKANSVLEASSYLDKNPPSVWFSRNPTERMEAWRVVRIAFDSASGNIGKMKGAGESTRIAFATQMVNEMMLRRAATDDILKRL